MRFEKLIASLADTEKALLSSTRETIAHGNSYPKCAEGSALWEICDTFRTYEAWQFSSDDPSVSRIVRENSGVSVQFAKTVEQAARRILFDCAFEIVCGLGASAPGNSPDGGTLDDWRNHTMSIAYPSSTGTDSATGYYLAERLSTHGYKFLKKLTLDYYNAERRNERLPVDMHLLVLARHWVDPHCPLWMMTLPALEAVLRKITAGGNWTPEVIRKRLKKMDTRGAKRFPKQPICAVKFGGVEWMRIERFTIVGEHRTTKILEQNYTVVGQKNRRRLSRVAKPA